MSSARTTLEGPPEASPKMLVWMGRPAGASRFASHHRESLFGYERGDLVGQPAELPVTVSRAHRSTRDGLS
jgi:hypothetical protein